MEREGGGGGGGGANSEVFFGGGGFILEMVVLCEDVGLSKIRLTHDNEVVDDGCVCISSMFIKDIARDPKNIYRKVDDIKKQK